ncbi:hypothetical protein [Fodinicola feengrottensis]
MDRSPPIPQPTKLRGRRLHGVDDRDVRDPDRLAHTAGYDLPPTAATTLIVNSLGSEAITAPSSSAGSSVTQAHPWHKTIDDAFEELGPLVVPTMIWLTAALVGPSVAAPRLGSANTTPPTPST